MRIATFIRVGLRLAFPVCFLPFIVLSSVSFRSTSLLSSSNNFFPFWSSIKAISIIDVSRRGIIFSNAALSVFVIRPFSILRQSSSARFLRHSRYKSLIFASTSSPSCFHLPYRSMQSVPKLYSPFSKGIRVMVSNMFAFTPSVHDGDNIQCLRFVCASSY